MAVSRVSYARGRWYDIAIFACMASAAAPTTENDTRKEEKPQTKPARNVQRHEMYTLSFSFAVLIIYYSVLVRSGGAGRPKQTNNASGHETVLVRHSRPATQAHISSRSYTQ